MVELSELVRFTDDVLEVDRFTDYCPNGLQVEGRAQVNRLVSGVTASRALIDAAVAAQADALLVHHGYFWRGEDARIIGMKRQRLAELLQNDMSLLAYHLPLDVHPLYGNNAQLGERLELTVEGRFAPEGDTGIGLYGHLPAAMTAQAFAQHIGSVLGRAPLHVAGGTEEIRTLAWCTGAAQGYIEEAADLGVDAYLSGEVSEQTVHVARERGLHYFAAGHHATERFGVQALGEFLARQLEIEHRFIDIDNPV